MLSEGVSAGWPKSPSALIDTADQQSCVPSQHGSFKTYRPLSLSDGYKFSVHSAPPIPPRLLRRIRRFAVGRCAVLRLTIT